MEVKFYDSVPEHLLEFAVIVSRYEGQWVSETPTAAKLTYPLIQPQLVEWVAQQLLIGQLFVHAYFPCLFHRVL